MKLVYILSILSICFFTSCSQDQLPEESSDINNQNIEPGGIHVRPPAGFEELDSEEQEAFVESLVEQDVIDYQENYRIAEYLNSVGKLEQTLVKLNKGQVLQNLQLSSFLSADQISELQDFQINNTISRSCVYTWISCFYRSSGWVYPFWKKYKKVWVKFCNGSYQGLYIYYTSISCF